MAGTTDIHGKGTTSYSGFPCCKSELKLPFLADASKKLLYKNVVFHFFVFSLSLSLCAGVFRFVEHGT